MSQPARHYRWEWLRDHYGRGPIRSEPGWRLHSWLLEPGQLRDLLVCWEWVGDGEPPEDDQ